MCRTLVEYDKTKEKNFLTLHRIVLSAGGTGGHIFPALAVADELRSRFSEPEILFIGGDKGPEKRLAGQAGLPFVSLPARGVLGKKFGAFQAMWCLVQSFWRCRKIFKDFSPEIVLGFGSYAGFMPVFSASMKGISTAIHEQNAQPGLTNKILGKRVDKVFVSFQETAGYFQKEKVVVTGNPVRRELIRLRERFEERKRLSGQVHVLVLGGSQGARGINDAIIGSLLFFQASYIDLWHQAGQADFERVKTEYQRRDCDSSRVTAFIDDMAAAYDWADLVVCRSGASTLTELAVVGKPGLLIPFPYAVKEHQLYNARLMEEAGAAIVVEQKYLHEIDLSQVINDLATMPGKLQEMAVKAYTLGNPWAATMIVDVLAKMGS